MSKNKLWFWLAIPAATTILAVAGLLWWRSTVPSLQASGLLRSIVSGGDISRYHVVDVDGKPLTNTQKNRLVREVLNPIVAGNRVVSEKLLDMNSGHGIAEATLEDGNGRRTILSLSVTKTPEGLTIPVSLLINNFWLYEADPEGLNQSLTPMMYVQRIELIRRDAPKLNDIGITLIRAENGEILTPEQLADSYEKWRDDLPEQTPSPL